MSRWKSHRLWVAPVYIGYVLLLALPLVFLAIAASNGFGDNFIHLRQTTLADYAFETLVLLPGVALFTSIIGISLAWVTTAYEFPGRRWLTVLLAVPFCIPPFVHGFIYHEIIGTGGIIHEFFIGWFGIDAASWPNIRSLWGVIIVFSLSLYAYIYLPLRLVFLGVIQRYRTVAGTLSASEGKFFFRIVLPLAAGTILSGTTLVWMDVISDYGLVEYFGINTISIGILRAWYGLGDLNLAALLSILTLIGVGVLLAIIFLFKRFFLYEEGLPGKSEELAAPRRLGRGSAIAVSGLCVLVVGIVVVLPILQLLFWILSGWSEVNFAHLLEVTLNTITLGLGGAILLLVLSFVLCYTARVESSQKWRSWYKRLRAYLSLSYALPGVVVAIGVVIALESLNEWMGLSHNNLFTIAVGVVPVLFAYQLRFSAVALNNFDPALEQISRETDDTARTLGVGGFSLLQKVFLPLLSSPIRTVFLMLSINLFKELPMTSFLRPIGFDTLAVDSFLKILDERAVQAAPGALIIILVSLVLFTLLLRAFSLEIRDRQP